MAGLSLLGRRCALCRAMLTLDALAVRRRVRGSVAGVEAELAVVEVLQGLSSERKKR